MRREPWTERRWIEELQIVLSASLFLFVLHRVFLFKSFKSRYSIDAGQITCGLVSDFVLLELDITMNITMNITSRLLQV